MLRSNATPNCSACGPTRGAHGARQLGRQKLRPGHTVIELIAAMIASAALLAGLGSVMMIARHVAFTPSASTHRLNAADIVHQLADELRYATLITHHVNTNNEQSLEFVVPDRDLPTDNAGQRIRYNWPAHPDPLVALDPAAPTGMFKTVNGHTWLVTKDVVAYQVALEPTFVPGQPFTRALVHLQTGTATHSRVDAAIPLIALPERLSAYWRTDFDTNPTTVDIDGSGEIDGDNNLESDWIVSNGATLAPGVMNNGTWQANGNMSTNPANNFTDPTVIEARCKNTAASGPVEVLRINADRASGVYAPLIVRMQRQFDGTQTLTLLGKPTSGSEQVLKAVENLADDYVRFRLIILPGPNTVALEVNDAGSDALGGPFVYPTHAPTTTDRTVTIGNAKFDYVDVRIRPSS